MTGYQPSKLMQQHLAAVESDPSKAMDLSPALCNELDTLSPEDLAHMAKTVKYSKGAPIHLTDDQNKAFRQQNQHMPTFSKNPGSVPKAPPGRFSGQAESVGNAMSDAWANFNGSFEAFKAEVFKPVPAELRVGRQEFIVQGATYKDQVGVALLNGGAFQDADTAKAQAERLQNVYPWFDFHVVSMFGWMPYPPDEETMRGVQRTYKDKNLDAIMRTHFANGVSGKKRQLDEMREVEARRGPRLEEAHEFPKNTLMVNMIDDDAPDGEVVAKQDSDVIMTSS